MKTSFYPLTGAIALSAFIVPAARAAEAAAPTRPNIVYIMSDDHAVQAISAYGHPISKLAPTPNIDRIARDGALFMRNYCANSISGPSRACIITGKHSHANGYMSNEWGSFDNRQNNVAKVFRANGYNTAIVGKWHIPADPTGFDYWQVFQGQGQYINPDIFCGNAEGRLPGAQYHQIPEGYSTEIVTNKAIEWMENGRDKSKPFFFMVHYKAPHRNWIPKEKNYNLFDGVKFPEPPTFFDDYAGRDAALKQDMSILWTFRWAADLKLFPSRDQHSLPRWMFPPHMSDAQYKKFIQAYVKKNEEFFDRNLMTEKELANFKQHHDDYVNREDRLAAADARVAAAKTDKERAAALADKAALEKRIAAAPELLSKNADRLREFQSWAYQRYLQDYLATIRGVDDGVGEILDYLKKTGLDKNTIVCYAADQGFYLGEHGWFDKRFAYEESFRMPLMMCGPGIKAGSKIEQLTQNIDFAPTFLDACGIKAPAEMQGVSFKKLLDGKMHPDWRNSLYYQYYEFPAEHSVRRHCAVNFRSHDGAEDWKLIHFYKEDVWELYNLNADPTEIRNVYGEPGTENVTALLKDEMKKLQAQYAVPAEYLTKGVPVHGKE
ncbi:sulfatase family protein [Candidatus Spyradosoma sp. SGI.093]|uniref:sulfatase family protein n=1 Tax=Candidatus Spyradosoma sp. SGI.093 TaxID=3420583 RepID=UPI003D065FC3